MLKVNNYFDGKVSSINLQTAILPATVGVIDFGEDQSETKQYDVMTVISGKLIVKLANEGS